VGQLGGAVAPNSGALHTGEAMQPPGAGGEEGLAAGQMVGAGFALPAMKA